MSEIFTIKNILEEKFKTYDKDFQKKLLQHKIFNHWNEIASQIIANDVLPLKIEGETLILYAKNSSAKDAIKFLAQDILNNANEKIGNGKKILKNISFAKSFERLKKNRQQNNFSAQKIVVDDIELTDEEISDCEKKIADIKNPDIKKIALKGLLEYKKTEKNKILNGWHKCKICGVLCEPAEKICGHCKIVERNKMREEIRKIFYKTPEKNFPTILKEIQKKFPNLKNECDENIIAHERANLIRELASRVSTGDKDSELVKILVMIYKRVPKEKLTDKLMNQTLYELRFDLSDRSPF